MVLFLMLARRPKRKSWLMKACDIPGGQRGTASMTSERSSIAPRARALRTESNKINGSYGAILDVGKEAKTEILANESLRHSGRTERDSEYDKRTIFDCAPGACAPGNNGAHDNFDLLWSGLAARVRGLAK